MQECPVCGQENPEIARFCLACGHQLAVEAGPGREERRVVSILFVDLVGFTSQADTLDPEDVRAILTPYHDSVRREIESFGGVVEKFIGDAVMAVFGAPTAFGDDAERAVRAALAVRDGIVDAHLRIAVHTGEALVSLAARPGFGESMVAGDVVNTASRLQQAAPVDGILVSDETYRGTRDVIVYEPAQAVVAKGKPEPIRAWVALRAKTQDEAAAPASALVGRRRELTLLRGIWEQVVEERTPHLVTVLGPAGVGKTRLTGEFVHVVDELGGASVRGRSLPYRESSAYGAFASQVKQLCHVFESDPPSVALDKVRDTLATMLDASAAGEVADHLAILIGLDPDRTVADRETLFFSVRRFIEAVARDRPTMLVFEDLHWADSSLLDLVELLAARLRELPVLIVAQARPELLDARPTWGGGLPAYTALPLGALNADDARELAAQRLSGPLDENLAARLAAVVETAAGNPLFIEQLAATVSESATGNGHALPTTIKGLVAARLDALPPAERSLLLDAAVAGKVFWRGALERIVADGDSLSELLGALERRDLIRRETVSAIEGDQQFTFTHVLIRDVAYELLPRAGRQERHAAVASFLEEATAEIGEAGAALARHWRDAGDEARALEYFVAAAEQAEQGWAKDRAVTFYREALGLVQPGDADRRSAIRRRLAVALQAAYHLPDARALGQQHEGEALAGEV
jgi:class 3 adenylate cyclase